MLRTRSIGNRLFVQHLTMLPFDVLRTITNVGKANSTHMTPKHFDLIMND